MSRLLPRWSLVLLCLPSAALLGYGAVVLPWQRMTAFALVTAVLAVLHLAVAALAAVRARRLPRVLRVLGLSSLLYLLWIAQQVVGSALYVAEIYGSLGKGVAAGMGAFVLVVALLTLPLGLWALALTAPTERPRSLWRWIVGGATVVCLAFAAASGATWAQAHAPRLPAPPDVAGRVAAALPKWQALPVAPGRQALFSPQAVKCSRMPSVRQATLVVTYGDREGRVRSACLQGSEESVAASLRDELIENASRGPIKLDWLTAAGELSPHPGLLGPLVDVLALRPGLDGACFARDGAGAACLMPWQLITTGVFAAREPTPYVPKLRLGVAVGGVRAALGAPPGGADAGHESIAGLVRVATQSLLVDARGRVRALRRMRERSVEVGPGAVEQAEHAAEGFLLRAQHSDGTFRYELDPYRDHATRDNPSIPRHAGATLVLCELGRALPPVDRAIARALAAQAGYARRFGELAALTYQPEDRHADLGSSALGLVAFTACRARGGTTHDALIGHLARFLMSMQLPDGSFRPGQDLHARRKLEGPTPMFAGGQAIMALTQLEEILTALPKAERGAFPPLSEVHASVERAMDYVADDYWPSPLREFFFLKENWHCLAARAALRSHRHDGYERFCIDYAEFKARMLLDASDRVDPELVGGYGFGNVVPPHVGSSAGLGEAIGAAALLREARGEDASRERARVKRVLGFLLRQQARPETCFPCRSRQASGWFPAFMVGPEGRIDHIQHPWSAIGHGARALGWRKS